MKDIRLCTSFWDHWKTVVLKSELGYPAIESLQRLWCFAAINKPNGALSGMSVRTIEISAHWTGEPGALVSKLVELRFLDAADGVFFLHDWEDHNGWVVHSKERSEQGKKGAAARWSKKNNSLPPNGGNKNADSNADSIAPGNAPTPTPTPTPTPKESSANAEEADAANAPSPPAAGLRLVKPPCPYEAIVALYHEVLPELRGCKTLTDTRKSYIRQRWLAKPGADLAKWRAFFEYVKTCPFLLGQSDGHQGRPPFVADLEWLVKPSNFAKIIEGKYERNQGVAHG